MAGRRWPTRRGQTGKKVWRCSAVDRDADGLRGPRRRSPAGVRARQRPPRDRPTSGDRRPGDQRGLCGRGGPGARRRPRGHRPPAADPGARPAPPGASPRPNAAPRSSTTPTTPTRPGPGRPSSCWLAGPPRVSWSWWSPPAWSSSATRQDEENARFADRRRPVATHLLVVGQTNAAALASGWRSRGAGHGQARARRHQGAGGGNGCPSTSVRATWCCTKTTSRTTSRERMADREHAGGHLRRTLPRARREHPHRPAGGPHPDPGRAPS